MGNANPFLMDTCEGTPAAVDAPEVQWGAWEALEGMARSAAASEVVAGGGEAAVGTLVLLSSPRAGYGKTHLLRRLSHSGVAEWFVVPLRFDLEHPVAWGAALDQVLYHCHGQPSPVKGGISLLSEISRRLFAALNGELIRRGQVYCGADAAETVAALKLGATDIYCLTDEASQVGQWFVENFEALLPALAESLSHWTGETAGSASEWLRVLCAYEQGHSDRPGDRWQSLQWGIRQISQEMRGGFGGGVQMLSVTSEGEQLAAKQRLREFLRLAGCVRLPVIAVDGIDVLVADPGACLRLGDLLTRVSAEVPRSLTAFSVNDDVWNAAFAGHLPGALVDRLSGRPVRLRGLGFAEAAAMVLARMEAVGIEAAAAERSLSVLNLAECVRARGEAIAPRELLRHCAARWEALGEAQREALAGTGPSPEASAAGEAGVFVPSLFPGGDPKLAPPPKAPVAINGQSAPEDSIKSGGHGEAGSQSGCSAAGVSHPDPALEAFEARMRGALPECAADPVRIALLLRIAGQQFPMVRYAEEAMPPDNGSPPAVVGVWKTGDMEVLFGVRPYGDLRYWRSVARHAARRATGHSKLAVFDSPDRGHVATFLPEGPSDPHIDLIELDKDALQRLFAASELLEDAENGQFPLPVPQALGGIVDELEFFWRRVTRPAGAPRR